MEGTVLLYAGNDYHCKSFPWYGYNYDTYYFNDTLWDGAGCIDNCCDDTTQPWFYHQLNQITQDDIETQICDEGSFSHMATLIDQLELYIQWYVLVILASYVAVAFIIEAIQYVHTNIHYATYVCNYLFIKS